MEKKPKVLLIDDEEVVLDSCLEILADSDYEIATAQDGAEGLRLVREFAPDLVVVDLKMPGIPGMTVLERICAADPTIVTIVITGFATVSSAVEAMKKGAFDFLPKPFTPEEFRLITRRSLEKRTLVLETIALRREKEMLRDHFAAIVSHELKAPVGALQQNLFVLEQELADALTEEQKARLARMKGRVDELLKMIHTWLRVISVDPAKLRERFQPVDVLALLARAIETVSPESTRKDIEVRVVSPQAVARVMGDEGALTEAFVNLIGNAVKYSHPGSPVQVKAEESEDGVVVSVIDAGVGIARDELPLIFEGFYRAASGVAVEKGSGLGLTVTRRIIEAHDGSISVESELGKGSTFKVRLPAASNASRAESREPANIMANSQQGGGG